MNEKLNEYIIKLIDKTFKYLDKVNQIQFKKIIEQIQTKIKLKLNFFKIIKIDVNLN